MSSDVDWVAIDTIPTANDEFSECACSGLKHADDYITR
jgi:hypothetical protein